MLELTPELDSTNVVPLYLQLYEYIRDEIQVANIQAGSKLPSQRKLAKHLKVSRNTVDAAYQQLLAEGYLQSEARKGLFVVELKNELFLTDCNISSPILYENPSMDTKQISKIRYDFSHGDIDVTHFPFEIWRKLSTQILYSDQSYLFQNGDPQGELGLRCYIADYLYQSRGVRCSPEQIVIGAGTQYLLNLLCYMIGRHISYAVEEPGFHRARHVFKDYGIDTKPINLDDKGISITELRRSGAKIAYVTPSHQYPIGIIMPVSRRIELIEWANEEEGLIIEDDYDGEFRYQGKPVPALQGLDKYGNVIYLGSFSKSLIPSIRLSYMVLPPSLLARYKEKFVVYKQTVSRFHQRTLELFMEKGHWDRHLNKVRSSYAKKRTVLLTAFKDRMEEQVRVIGAEAGLHVLLQPDNTMSEEELIASAEQEGVKVYPTSIYYEIPPTHKKPLVLLGFGGVDIDQIDEGIALLQRAWFKKGT